MWLINNLCPIYISRYGPFRYISLHIFPQITSSPLSSSSSSPQMDRYVVQRVGMIPYEPRWVAFLSQIGAMLLYLGLEIYQNNLVKMLDINGVID